MADGYARSGKGVGVVITSTGPGACYMVSPLLEAWGSSSPVLAITTNLSTDKIGQGLGALHELAEQDAIFKNVTKARFCLRPGDDAQATAQRAVTTALAGRPGPVYLEVPSDMWDQEAATDAAGQAQDEAPGPAAGLDQAVALLRQAERPVIIAGTEAVRAGIGPDVTALAESLSAPVVTVIDAKGIIPEDHPLAFGNFARRGALQELFETCDATLAIGTRLRQTVFGGRNVTLPQLIHVDWDERWVNKNHPAKLALIGDLRETAREFREQLAGATVPRDREEWVANLRQNLDRRVSEVNEAQGEMRYVDVFRRVLPRDGDLLVDNTVLGYWADYSYPSYKSGGLVSPRGASPIGWALPAAMGLKTACSDRPLVAVVGDGGFFYGAQELATCARYGIGFPLVVVNDRAYGVIGYLQQAFYQQTFESDLTNPDFVALVKSFGVSAVRVDSPESLEKELETALGANDMRVIELVTPALGTPFTKY
jgi:acetolactate synthase-1/2/3 large subunit